MSTKTPASTAATAPLPAEPPSGEGTLGLATRGVHGREARPRGMSAVTTPIVAASTFPFESFDDAVAVVERRLMRDDYVRYGNPTVRQAEEHLAALEGAEDAALFSSGMAALTAVLMTFLQAGQHIVLLTECYRPTEQLVADTFGRFGVRSTTVPGHDLAAVRAAIEPGVTRMILLEWPTNPHLRLADLAAIDALRKEFRGIRLVVDATLATPFCAQPLTWGVDLVVHSCTKFLGGHNDLLAGSVAGRTGFVQAVRDVRSRTGATLDPHSAFLLTRGLKSLVPRMRQHCASAQAVAEFLQAHPAVQRVWYPGLASHPEHEQAAARMNGCGGLISFEHVGDFAGTRRFCDALQVVQLAASLGGTETLTHPPALFSYWDLSPEERGARNMPDNLIRLSVGLETLSDILADLDQALQQVMSGEGTPADEPTRGA
jgi:cystathionine gamma-synthase